MKIWIPLALLASGFASPVLAVQHDSTNDAIQAAKQELEAARMHLKALIAQQAKAPQAKKEMTFTFDTKALLPEPAAPHAIQWDTRTTGQADCEMCGAPRAPEKPMRIQLAPPHASTPGLPHGQGQSFGAQIDHSRMAPQESHGMKEAHGMQMGDHGGAAPRVMVRTMIMDAKGNVHEFGPEDGGQAFFGKLAPHGQKAPRGGMQHMGGMGNMEAMHGLMGSMQAQEAKGGCDCDCACSGGKEQAPKASLWTVMPGSKGQPTTQGFFTQSAPQKKVQTWTTTGPKGLTTEKQVFLFSSDGELHEGHGDGHESSKGQWFEDGAGQPIRIEVRVDGGGDFSFGDQGDVIVEEIEDHWEIADVEEHDTNYEEHDSNFEWVFDSEDGDVYELEEMDFEIEALIRELEGQVGHGGQHGEHHVIQVIEDEDFPMHELGASIEVELEDIYEGETDLDNEIEALIRALESEGEVQVEAEIITVAPKAVSAKEQSRIAELESEVEELRGLVESLVKELNKR